MICFLSDSIHALSVEISCSAEYFSTEIQESLSVLRIELLKCRCEFTLIYGFLDLLRKLSAQFIQLLLVSFDIGQVLAQLTGGMCILLYRLQHCMNVVPQPSLELFQALISFYKFLIKLISKLSQLITQTFDLFEHFLIRKFLILLSSLKIFVLFSGFFLGLFFNI